MPIHNIILEESATETRPVQDFSYIEALLETKVHSREAVVELLVKEGLSKEQAAKLVGHHYAKVVSEKVKSAQKVIITGAVLFGLGFIPSLITMIVAALRGGLFVSFSGLIIGGLVTLFIGVVKLFNARKL